MNEAKTWIPVVARVVIALAAIVIAYSVYQYLVVEPGGRTIASRPPSTTTLTTTPATTDSGMRNLATDQSACYRMQQQLLSEQQQQIAGNASMSVTARNHYNVKLNKCMVELDFTAVYSNGTISNDYAIYDAVENNELIDCTIAYGPNASGPLCFNDSHPEQATIPTITKSEFDALEQQYMTE